MKMLLSVLTDGQAIAAVVAAVVLVAAVVVIASVLTKQKKTKQAVGKSKPIAAMQVEQKSNADVSSEGLVDTNAAEEQTAATEEAAEQEQSEQDTSTEEAIAENELEVDEEEAAENEIISEVEEIAEAEDVAEEQTAEEELAEDATQEQAAEEAVEVDDVATEEVAAVEETAVEDKIVEEEPIEEEQPTEEVPEPVTETHPFAEEKPAKPAKTEKKATEKKLEEKKPVIELKPSSDRERAVIIDDKPVLIKDDRFLFNPEEDGFYYVLEKTFTAKLIQASDTVKDYYTELKNELLSYKKIHARMSKKRESFNFGRQCLARLSIRGKTIRLHLALDPHTYDDTKYKVEDSSEVKSLADTPLMYRIRNHRREMYAKDLIAAVMAQHGVQRQEIEPINYAENYPYEPTEVLIEKGLITKRRVQGKMPEGNGFEFAQKTFKAKLIQAEEFVKDYYSQLKNHLLTYRKIHDRMSKSRESYRFGRTCVARMSIRGKTLKLYLALNAADYEDSKYKVEDASSVKAYADTPLLYKIKNTRRLRYAKDLIDVMMANLGIPKKREADEFEHDYAADLPYESTEELLEEGLIVNKFVAGNSFIAQHFKRKDQEGDQAAESEAAATKTTD